MKAGQGGWRQPQVQLHLKDRGAMFLQPLMLFRVRWGAKMWEWEWWWGWEL